MPRVAVVHDWLTGMRGGEKVLAEILRMLPCADVFTLLWRRGSVSPLIEARVKGVSFLDHLPRRFYRYYLPLFPAAIRSLDLRGYRLIVSSSHAVAKGVRVPPGATHISYVHTPMRYLWDARTDYFQFGSGLGWKRAALDLAAPALRRFDVSSARGVDLFIANSQNVRARIGRLYGAAAEVVYPPVDTAFFTPSPGPAGDYYLAVCSLEPYKRVDMAVKAFSGTARRLIVVGKGTQERALRAVAAPPVEFAGEVSDEHLRELYRGCRALVFPGREDFGMVMVEAQACGRPVVAYADGGALESVADGRSGVLFSPQTPEALAAAVVRLESIWWEPAEIRQQALRFSRVCFRQRLSRFLEAPLADCA